MLSLLALAAPAGAAETDVAATLVREARHALLDAAAAAGLDGASATVQLAARKPPPACAGRLAVEPVDLRHPARLRVVAHCDAPAWREEFVLRGELKADVVVTTAAVPAGRPIAAAELALEPRTLTGFDAATSALDEVAGRASRRSLRAGQPVDPRSLVEAVLVKRGATVSIVASSGPVQVTTRGEALAAGRAGDTIDVRNSATGRVIRARVTARDTVEPAELPAAPIPQPPR